MNEYLIAPMAYPHMKRNFELRLLRGGTRTGMNSIVIQVYEGKTLLGSCTLAPKYTSVILKQKALGRKMAFPGDFIEPAIRQFKERHYVDKFLAGDDPDYTFEDTLML